MNIRQKAMMSKLTFNSSNTAKIEAFSALGLTCISDGKDIHEVLGTIEETIIHKCVAVEPFVVVEDSVVTTKEAGDIVDWKFTFLDHAKDGVPFVWNVSLAFHDGVNLFYCTSKLPLTFFVPEGFIPETCDFDPYAKTHKTAPLLGEQKKSMGYDYMDPRSRALETLTTALLPYPKVGLNKIPLSVIAPWKGPMQPA